MATPQIPQVQVQPRPRIGSRYAARLREAGRLPAVIYGHKQEPVHVSLDRRQVVDLLHGHAHLLEVMLDSKPQPVLVKDIQWDHLGTTVMHLDLTRVDLTERVKVHVPLVLIGEAPGLKDEGAILENPVTSIEIECLATAIPERLKLDVGNLKVNEVITVRDLKLPEGVTCTVDTGVVLASITVVAEEVVEEVAPVEGAAEPEVIGRKVEEGAEGEEGAAAAGEKKPAAGAAPPAGEKKAAEKK